MQIAMALVCAMAIVIPLVLGLPTLALAGVGLLLVMGISVRAVDHDVHVARLVAHLVYFLALAAVAYAVFGLQIPTVITVYFPSLVLLGSAHILGARAALAWAVPSAALVAAGVFLPSGPEREVSDIVTFATRSGTLLTILGFGLAFRRAHDRQARELEHRATTDALTGLPNRIALHRALANALSRCARFGRRGAVVFVDMDGMKRINDSHGHGVGDAFLKEISTRIRAVTRSVDTPSRMGGDEFVVLLSEFDDPKGAEIYARKLLSVLTRPWQAAGEELRPSASIGIAPFPEAGMTADELLRVADSAMYQAKRSGGRRAFIGDPSGLREVS